MKLIAEGNNLEELGTFEGLLFEGQEGEVRVYLDTILSGNAIADIEQRILDEGVVLTHAIVQDAGILSIKFRKELAPLAIIAIAVGGVVALGFAGILGWQLFEFLTATPWWVWWVAGGLLIYVVLVVAPQKTAREIGAGVREARRK